MNRVDFGRLIASLRKEHEDEEGNPWSQDYLAQEANGAAGADLFSEDIIGRIERGKRSLDNETLLALAAALHLTS
jgi:transcriptional regulator with XRE-family HTH domain